MDSTPQQQPAAEKQENGLEQMEFELDEEFLKVQQHHFDDDQELLQIQRRKSTPKVVVEEFVQVDSDDDNDANQQPKLEENKEGEDFGDSKVNNRPHRLKTHIEIEDVSALNDTSNCLMYLAMFFY